jgi:hypothetical protein
MNNKEVGVIVINRFLLLISGLTIFMAGLTANFEYDLKKINWMKLVQETKH